MHAKKQGHGAVSVMDMSDDSVFAYRSDSHRVTRHPACLIWSPSFAVVGTTPPLLSIATSIGFVSYVAVLEGPPGQLAGLKRIQRRHRVPVVLTREEVKAVLSHMRGALA